MAKLTTEEILKKLEYMHDCCLITEQDYNRAVSDAEEGYVEFNTKKIFTSISASVRILLSFHPLSIAGILVADTRKSAFLSDLTIGL